VSASRPGRYLPPEKDQVPIAQEAGWDPGPVWTGKENLASTGIRFPDRPYRSQSLYRLRYPAHYTVPIRKHKSQDIIKVQERILTRVNLSLHL